MQLDEQQILSLSRDVWSARLGLTIQEDLQADPATEERTWSSRINVSGPWQGAILVECSESIVRHAATMLFETDGDSPSEEDIQDAIKELAAMLGQKMSPMLPESSKLSRPSVVKDQADTLEGHQHLSELTLSCEGRPVRIALLEKQQEAAAAS